MQLTDDEQAFIERAKVFTGRTGPEAVLLLVGSRAAGLADSWSDLDLWVIGDKGGLSAEESSRYDAGGGLFVDRGDYEAHWIFFDARDLSRILDEWPDEKMWLILTSQVLAGNAAVAADLKARCGKYPAVLLEGRLKWHFGHYWSSLPRLSIAARGHPETGFLMAAKVIDHLCRLSCLAEKRPFPYAKWLPKVARDTAIGRAVWDHVSRAVLGIHEFLELPSGKHFRELVP